MSGPPPAGVAELTLIVAVYNGVRALRLILLALDRQTFGGFEVVVADDGSGPEVSALVADHARAARYPLRHVRHEDDGFRKNAILNRAVASAATPYVVFIDGDCLPHRRFLEDHAGAAEDGAVLCGRRVNLGAELSAAIVPATVADGSFERFSARLLLDSLRGRSSWVEDAIRVRNPLLRRALHPGPPSILGCNFSVHRRWLERINGFNEEYRAPGLGEDSDVAFRLGLAGARLKSLRNLAVLFHLHHPRTVVGDRNRELYDRVVSTREMVCRNGLVKLAEPVHAR